MNNASIAVWETLMDSKSLFLTPNPETVYAIGWARPQGWPARAATSNENGLQGVL